MSIHLFHCAVCNTDLNDTEHWLRHLLDKYHQKQARIEISQWNNEIRNCAVILYSSFSLVNYNAALSLLQHFTNGTTVVTDIVMSSGSPNMSIVQLESREKVKEVFPSKGVTGASLYVAGQLVQFRRLAKLMELEWHELLRNFQGLQYLGPPETNGCTLEDEPLPNNNIYRELETSFQNKKTLTKKPTTNGNLVATTTLHDQVCSVIKSVEIPDDEFHLVSNIISEMNRVCRKSVPNLRLEMYRNNNLKLRNNYSNGAYLIFMFNKGSNEEGTFWNRISPETCPLLNVFRAKRSTILSDLKIMNIDNISYTSEKLETHLVHSPTGIRFKIDRRSLSVVELQLSKLLMYYCRFNGWLKKLLALVYYWAKENEITLARKRAPQFRNKPCRGPDPLALEWLLLFYLFHETKLLPLPKDILAQPHEPCSQKVNDLGSKIPEEGSVDLGFTEDQDYINKWRAITRDPSLDFPTMDHFLLHTLQNFMTFYTCKVKTKSLCILDTSSGEIWGQMSKRKFGVRGPFNGTIKAIRNFNKSQKKIFRTSNCYGNICQNLVMNHPLHPRWSRTPTWKLSIDYDKWRLVVCPAMKKTAKNLAELMQNLSGTTPMPENLLHHALSVNCMSFLLK